MEHSETWLNRMERARKLKFYRGVSGMKGKDIAKKLGVSQAYYSRMEMGTAAIKDEYLSLAKELFAVWRISEVSKLKGHIDYLLSIE